MTAKYLLFEGRWKGKKRRLYQGDQVYLIPGSFTNQDDFGRAYLEYIDHDEDGYIYDLHIRFENYPYETGWFTTHTVGVSDIQMIRSQKPEKTGFAKFMKRIENGSA